MPGEKGRIIQGKKAKVSVYLGNSVRMFKKGDDRIRLATEDLIASINKDGRVTNSKRLYKILDILYKREHIKSRKK